MTQETLTSPPRPTFLEVSLKAAAIMQSMTTEELAVLEEMLRRLFTAPSARRGRPPARAEAILAMDGRATVLANFLAGHTVPNPKGRIRTKDFMLKFLEWVRDEGISDRPNQDTLYETMAQEGYPKRKSNGQQVFAGLSWNAVPADPVMEGAI